MSRHPLDENQAVKFECVIPILNVKSISTSLHYYTEVLGFKVDWSGKGEHFMASVSRAGISIMLCQGSQGQAGTWIWIGVEDIEPLFAEYMTKGAKIQQKPTNYPWAYEMRIEDPDGHILCFGSDTMSDRPIDLEK